MKTLGYSLFEILYGCCSPSLLSSHPSLLAVGHLRERMTRGGFRPLNGPALADAVTCISLSVKPLPGKFVMLTRGFWNCAGKGSPDSVPHSRRGTW